jgi:hypothetical protein
VSTLPIVIDSASERQTDNSENAAKPSSSSNQFDSNETVPTYSHASTAVSVVDAVAATTISIADRQSHVSMPLLDAIATSAELLSCCDVLERSAMRVGDARDVDEIHLTTCSDVNDGNRRVEFDVASDARLAGTPLRRRCRLVPPDALDHEHADGDERIDEFNDVRLRAGVSAQSIRAAATRAPSSADALPPTRHLRALSRQLAVRSSLWCVARFSVAHRALHRAVDVDGEIANNDDDDDELLPDVSTLSYDELPFVAAVRQRQRAAERGSLDESLHMTLNDAARCMQLVYMSQICDADLLAADLTQRRRARYHLRYMNADERTRLAAYRKAFL